MPWTRLLGGLKAQWLPFGLFVVGLSLLVGSCGKKQLSLDSSELAKCDFEKGPVGMLVVETNKGKALGLWGRQHKYCTASIREDGSVVTAKHCVQDESGVSYPTQGMELLFRSARGLETRTTVSARLKDPISAQYIGDWAVLSVPDAKRLLRRHGFISSLRRVPSLSQNIFPSFEAQLISIDPPGVNGFKHAVLRVKKASVVLSLKESEITPGRDFRIEVAELIKEGNSGAPVLYKNQRLGLLTSGKPNSIFGSMHRIDVH